MNRLLLTLTALILGLAPPLAAQTDLVRLTWRSSPEDPAAQTRELTRLYLALYNSGNLRVREAENADGQFVEPFATAQGAIIGRGLTPAVDAMLCDLNPRICRRTLTEAAPETFADLSAHVGGYAVTPVAWRLRAGDPVVLPDYQFATYTTLRTVPVDPGWSASDYVAPPAADCSGWDMDCQGLVAALNPPLYKQQATIEATVPVTAYATEVTVAFGVASRFAKALQSRSEKGDPAARTLAWSPGYTDFVATAEMSELVLDALGTNVVLVGDVKTFAPGEEPLFNDQVSLFRLIGHPFASGAELPAEYRHPVRVVVLDQPFEGGHCDIAVEDMSATAGPDDACSEIAAMPNPVSDHAIHIIGQIGAPINHKGIVGLDPYSSVSFAPINKVFSAEADLLDARDKLLKAALGGARVANLSWGFENLQPEQDVFAFAVSAVGKQTLIVAAAGNQATDLTGRCLLIPACLHELPNVVTVVGLNRNADAPGLWTRDGEGSNSNGAFSVGAIAEGVLSTVADNKLGQMSGTSQAAPQVTATAALIYSVAEDIYPELTAGAQRLAPKVVKDRIIYTSDPFRDLQTKVMGGRLNVDRAIRIVDTQLVLRPATGAADDSPRHLSGRLTTFPEGNLIICLSPAGEQEEFHWSSIRRLVFEKGRNRYIIFRHQAPSTDPANRNDFPLKRIDGCNMTTLSNSAVLQTETGDVAFQLRDVLDYTSGMIE